MATRSVQEQLDHYLLNEIGGRSNPSAEQLFHWICNRFFETSIADTMARLRS